MKKMTFIKYLQTINEELEPIIIPYRHVFDVSSKNYKIGEGKENEDTFEVAINKMEKIEKKEGISLVLPTFKNLQRLFNVEKNIFRFKRNIFNNKTDKPYLTDKKFVGMKITRDNKVSLTKINRYDDAYVIFQKKVPLNTGLTYKALKTVKRIKNKLEEKK